MPDAITVTFRGIVVEDFMMVTVAGPATTTVLGVGKRCRRSDGRSTCRRGLYRHVSSRE
jgi:methionine-rich copper-binding protein CopC